MVRTPYRVALRLCVIASERWDEIVAAYYQIDIVRLRPHKFASLVYAWCVERVPEDKFDEWWADLNDVLPWESADSEAAAELESASFMAMMSKGGG